MTSLNVNFDLAIAGGPKPAAPPHRNTAPDAFGSALQSALNHADDRSETAIDRRPRSRRDPDADAHESRARKDKDADTAASTDAATISSTSETIRPVPIPPPANEGGTNAGGNEGAELEAPADLSDAFRGIDRTNESPAPGTSQLSEAARQASQRSQRDAKNAANDQSSALAEISGDVANNLAAILEQIANGNATGQPVQADSQLTEREWQRAMLAKLSSLAAGSPSDRTGAPGNSPAGGQVPTATEWNKKLAAIANEAAGEQRSSAAKAFGASGIGELFDAEKTTNTDRHPASALNYLRLESSMVTPMRLATDGAGSSAPAAAIEQRAIDTDLPEQIIQSIRVQALDLGGEARVRLRPEYLGEVVVSVKVDAGSVTATLQSDTPAVRRWIETHEASLRIGLADHGLHLDRLVVSESAKSDSEPEERRRQSAQEEPAQREPRRPQRKPEEESGTFEVVV